MSAEKQLLNMPQCIALAQQCARRLAQDINHRNQYDYWCYGVPRGGLMAAQLVMAELRREFGPSRIFGVTEAIETADFVFDDLLDSGTTKSRCLAKMKPGAKFEVLLDKNLYSEPRAWIVFPWEVGDSDTSADDIVIRLLQYIGEDPMREGLRETPRRFLKAWKEWTSGYGQDPVEVLKTFEDGAEGTDEMVLVRNLPIVSKCEHHLADIIGTVHVGYIPNGRIIGLSKIPRLVNIFARRLQVQERLTNQIANALHEGLQPKAVGVVIHAHHACMATRGVNIHGSVTTTSALRGALRADPAARAEFLRLCEAK